MADNREKQRDREDELDRFWDIDALLPRRRSFARSEKTDAHELELPPPDAVRVQESASDQPIPKRETEQTVIHSVSSVWNAPVHHLVNPQSAVQRNSAPKPDDEYAPDCALIHHVRVFRWKSSYQYYEDFVKTAEKLQSVRGVPCQPVKFFSYVPQYAQMTRAQFGWYLWFRECVRRGEYPETDYSYVLLYAYEIINLPQADRQEGQRCLLGLWLHYREAYRQLDSYLPDWICDYSLIHHLPPPADLGADARAALMQRCGLKEFYVGGNSEDGYLQALLTFCSNYDYQKSKFCTEENLPLFRRLMLTSLRAVTTHLSEDGKLFSASGMEDSKLTRDAYSGALCSYRIKRKLEVAYCSFSRSHELRFLITDVLKYTENKIRGALGVRSKLTVYALPVNIRELIDGCVGPLLPKRESPGERRQREADRAYAHLYDVPKAPLNLSHAAEIEQISWDTTQKLVDAFAEESPEKCDEMPVQKPESLPIATELPTVSAALEPEAGEDDVRRTLSPYRRFLQAALSENGAEQRLAAKELGKLVDAVAEEINELAADLTGDVLLEDADAGYRVIDDYRDWLIEAL